MTNESGQTSHSDKLKELIHLMEWNVERLRQLSGRVARIIELLDEPGRSEGGDDE